MYWQQDAGAYTEKMKKRGCLKRSCLLVEVTLSKGVANFCWVCVAVRIVTMNGRNDWAAISGAEAGDSKGPSVHKILPLPHPQLPIPARHSNVLASIHLFIVV